jgi:hypothetical protein
MSKELCVLACLPLTGRFVRINGSVSGVFDDAFRDSAGEFWTMLRNLVTVMMPQRRNPIGPMLPNPGTAA